MGKIYAATQRGRAPINLSLTKKHGIAFVFQRHRPVQNELAPVSRRRVRAWGRRIQLLRTEGIMTNPLLRGAGFTPPVRSVQTLRGIALPQLVTLLALALSTAAMLMAVTWSVGSAGKRMVPISSNIQSRLL
jgi:hypothetical protein